MKAEHEDRIAIVTGMAQERAAHVIRFAADIGQRDALVSTRSIFMAMPPDRHPAEGRTIDIELVGCDYADHEASYWTVQQDNLRRVFARKVKERIEQNEIKQLSVFAFASRLTARRAQTIVGLGIRPASLVMFLFDEGTIGGVLGAFADEARALWGDDCGTRDVWAVASRHNLPGTKGAWRPKSLVDYHPAYRSEGGSRGKANLLCRQLQKAAVHHAAARPPAEVGEMLAVGVSGLARVHGWKAANDRPITAHNIWATLSHRDLALPRAVRRLLRDHVLAGDAVWDQAAWLAFLEQLLLLFSPHPQGADAEIADFCGFVAEQKADLADPERRSTKQVQFDDLTLRLGSIHSVKGKSVDGILVVESEIWKGSGADEQCIDLTTVLPRAFGVTDQPFTGVGLTAATNVFVGVTRPRELLGLALRKSEAMVLIGPATDQGWKLVDLVAQAGELKE